MTLTAPPGGFHGPVKRSITIAGHATSISLEPVFWQALERAAVARALPLSALVGQIDALRIVAPDPLHSAVYDSHPPAAIRIAHLKAMQT